MTYAILTPTKIETVEADSFLGAFNKSLNKLQVIGVVDTSAVDIELQNLIGDCYHGAQFNDLKKDFTPGATEEPEVLDETDDPEWEGLED